MITALFSAVMFYWSEIDFNLGSFRGYPTAI
ncbi:Uncharacterised protein [Pragia fontium]|nr:Uncharacterised protein [Pragia fontium]